MLVPTHVPALREWYRRAGLWRGETITQALDVTAARDPSRPAVVDGATRIAAGEL